MAIQDDRTMRTDWARWFIEHDEVDEAARVLVPGDELPLGRSDALDLLAALGRHGLAGHYEDGRASVVGEVHTEGARRPPARAAVARDSAKKTASVRGRSDRS